MCDIPYLVYMATKGNAVDAGAGKITASIIRRSSSKRSHMKKKRVVVNEGGVSRPMKMGNDLMGGTPDSTKHERVIGRTNGAVSSIISAALKPRKSDSRSNTNRKRIIVNEVVAVDGGTMKMSGGARMVTGTVGGTGLKTKHVKVPASLPDEVITGSMTLKTEPTPASEGSVAPEARGEERAKAPVMLEELTEGAARKKTMGEIIGQFITDIIDLQKED